MAPDDDDDSLEAAYAQLFAPSAPTQPLPWAETDDAPELPEASPPVPVDLDSLPALFPNADPTYLVELASQAGPDFFAALIAPMTRRARLVRDLLLSKRSITASSIAPLDPRGIRELEDFGIPLAKHRVRENLRSVTSYALDPSSFSSGRSHRLAVSPIERQALLDLYKGFCNLCGTPFPSALLHCDHRRPYSREGNSGVESRGSAALQLVCTPCNNRKATVCRSCHIQTPADCADCLYASPEAYSHIAGKPHRQLTLVAQTPEDQERLRLFQIAWATQCPPPESQNPESQRTERARTQRAREPREPSILLPIGAEGPRGLRMLLSWGTDPRMVQTPSRKLIAFEGSHKWHGSCPPRPTKEGSSGGAISSANFLIETPGGLSGPPFPALPRGAL